MYFSNMDALIVQNNSTAVTTTSSNNSPDIHHNHSAQPHVLHCRSTEAQLLDIVTKSLVSVDKWVAQEIDRISHDYSPRNCINYEALLYVIEGFYQMDQYSSDVAKKQQYEKREQEKLHEDFVDEDSKEEDMESNDLDDKNYYTVTPTINNEQYTDNFRKSQKNDNYDGDKRSITETFTDKVTTTTSDQLTQKNLVLAFYKLIYYCQNESPQFYHNQQRKPLELLIELENICETRKTQQEDIQSCQKRLAHILFGTNNTPTPNKLIDAWNMIRLWVQQEIDTLSPIQQRKWIIFGMYSYQIAKKICGINNAR